MSLHQNYSFNTTTNICEGCGSNLDEIVDWTRMTEKNNKFLLDCLKTEIIMWEGENIY